MLSIDRVASMRCHLEHCHFAFCASTTNCFVLHITTVRSFDTFQVTHNASCHQIDTQSVSPSVTPSLMSHSNFRSLQFSLDMYRICLQYFGRNLDVFVLICYIWTGGVQQFLDNSSYDVYWWCSWKHTTSSSWNCTWKMLYVVLNATRSAYDTGLPYRWTSVLTGTWRILKVNLHYCVLLTCYELPPRFSIDYFLLPFCCVCLLYLITLGCRWQLPWSPLSVSGTHC